MLGDYHYLQTVEPIKQLKRDGLEEALVLCYGAIQASWRPTTLALCVGPDRLDTAGCRAASFRRLRLGCASGIRFNERPTMPRCVRAWPLG